MRPLSLAEVRCSNTTLIRDEEAFGRYCEQFIQYCMMLPSGPSPAGGRLIADGDLVIVYERFDSMKSAVVNVKKGQLQNRHGQFLHREWAGKVSDGARHIQAFLFCKSS